MLEASVLEFQAGLLYRRSRLGDEKPEFGQKCSKKNLNTDHEQHRFLKKKMQRKKQRDEGVTGVLESLAPR